MRKIIFHVKCHFAKLSLLDSRQLTILFGSFKEEIQCFFLEKQSLLLFIYLFFSHVLSIERGLRGKNPNSEINTPGACVRERHRDIERQRVLISIRLWRHLSRPFQSSHGRVLQEFDPSLRATALVILENLSSLRLRLLHFRTLSLHSTTSFSLSPGRCSGT